MKIGWIDFSPSDRDKVLSVIHLADEKGAVDELGIGVIRDAFAERFFPGTTTIQTKLKYFFLVPHILQDVVRSTNETDPQKLLLLLHEKERECCEMLKNNSDEKAIGIIGSTRLDNDKWIKRKPSDIYWGGIKALGIYTRSADSITDYLSIDAQQKAEKNSMNSLGKARTRSNQEEVFDDQFFVDNHINFWTLPYKKWKDNCQLEVTADEKRFFINALQKSHPNSLFNKIVNSKIAADDLTSFDKLGVLAHFELPEHEYATYKLGVTFSEFIYVARVCYNVSLSNGANEKANEEWDKIKGNLSDISRLDIDAIAKALGINIAPALRGFLFDLKKAYQSDKPQDRIIEIVRHREKQIKGSRAKLGKPYEKPQEWIGGGRLDYRLGIVKDYVKELNLIP